MIIPENMSFEQLVLDEIGLEFSQDGYLIDQDTRQPLLYLSQPVVRRDVIRRNCHRFDPLNNPKFMNFLFSYFSNKLRMEQDICINVVYYKVIQNSRNSPLAIKANENKEYVSRIYSSETIKYLDLICQLNGGVDVDLSRYDVTDT